jgi:hypothetical protein
MNISGLVGDTISFMYAVDFEVEKTYFGSMELHSCRHDIKQIILNVKLGEHGQFDD